LHFDFPEKNLQYYPDFLSTESFLPSYRRFSFATDESGRAKGGCCKRHRGLIAGGEPPQEPLKRNCFEEAADRRYGSLAAGASHNAQRGVCSSWLSPLQ
jgi:hypothetical protein